MNPVLRLRVTKSLRMKGMLKFSDARLGSNERAYTKLKRSRFLSIKTKTPTKIISKTYEIFFGHFEEFIRAIFCEFTPH